MQSIFKNSRILLCFVSIIYIFAYLMFEYSTTGIQGHYLLHDSSLPYISNWWGLIIIPLVTLGLTTLINKYYGKNYPKQVWVHLAGAGIYAAINSTIFFSGHVELVTIIALPSVVILALFYPIYRADYILGYYIVSTIGFGAVIPLIGSSIFAVIGFFVHKFIRPIPLYLLKYTKR